MSSLQERYQSIQHSIENACDRAGRKANEISLVAVSKTHPKETIQELYDLGHRSFGENKIQEGLLKVPDLPKDIEWRMIGHLQTNKCRDAVRLFHMIESVDSLKVAQELQKHGDRALKQVPVLLEINVAGEATKYGFRPSEALEQLEALNDLSRLEIHGLMTIAPYTQEPERVRPFFQQLRELRDELETQLGAPLPTLSMGMSGDYEIAIEEGATVVRVGSAIFGPRRTGKKKTEG